MTAEDIVALTLGRVVIENALMREDLARLTAGQQPVRPNPVTRHDDGPNDGVKPIEAAE